MPRKMYSLKSPTLAVSACSGGGGDAGVCANAPSVDGIVSAAAHASAAIEAAALGALERARARMAQSNLMYVSPRGGERGLATTATHGACPRRKHPLHQRLGPDGPRRCGCAHPRSHQRRAAAQGGCTALGRVSRGIEGETNGECESAR